MHGHVIGAVRVMLFLFLLGTAKINTYKKTLYNSIMLPDSELSYLNSLDDPSERLRALHEAGWSLSTLASSLTPPVPKSTVHYRIKKAPSSDTSRPTPAPFKPLQTRSISPSVPPAISNELPELAYLAQRYRFRTPPSHPSAVANRRLTEITLSLYRQGVPVKDIAKSAKVSQRAIFRRITKASKA